MKSKKYYDTIPFPYRIIVNPENNNMIYVTSALKDNMTIINLKTGQPKNISTHGAILGDYAINDNENIIRFVDNNPENPSLITFDYKNNTFVKKNKI